MPNRVGDVESRVRYWYLTGNTWREEKDQLNPGETASSARGEVLNPERESCWV